MSNKVKKQMQDLLEVLQAQPEAVSLDQLIQLMSYDSSKRTLQYRLAVLIQGGVVKKQGSGKNIKYYVNRDIQNNAKTSSLGALQKPFRIPLSLEAEQIRQKISIPIQKRPYVSYRREFLDSYEPNKTFYLSPSILEKLEKLGSDKEKGRPAGTYARKIYQRLLIDLSWNSSRLEGNTYSLLETEKLLEIGQEIPGKNWMDTQMLLNHKAAIEFIVDMAEEVDINAYTILNIHGLLSHNLLMDPKACGKLRTIPVKIGQSVYRPLEVPQLIEECFQQIIQKAFLIKNPFEQAFFLMVQLPYLQPFLDVNKRVSRLACNIPFIRENLSPLSFIDVPEADYIEGLLAIYELNRVELFRDVFVWAYERSASLYLATLESLGEPDPFRVQYRDWIQKAVRTVVQKKMNKLTAVQFFLQFANEHIPAENRKRFIEIVEIEVRSLHVGNFARFKIHPTEFFSWQSVWE